MVRDIRIKNYLFGPIVGNTGSPTVYTDHTLNGEILRIISLGNFTGSIQLYESGTNTYQLKMIDISNTSGTGLTKTFPLTNTTGSFCVNTQMMLMISGVTSGTNNIWGPIEILYR